MISSVRLVMWTTLMGCWAHGWSQSIAPLPTDDSRISTVLFHPTGLPIGPPVVPLDHPNPLGHLTLRFDQIHGDEAYWEVRVIHCNKHWEPSDLQPNEYIRGFYSTPIEDLENSFGTKVDFTHFSITLPNSDLQWTRSGNYLLEVFDPYEPEVVVISRRFVVFEDLCSVEASVAEPADIALRRTHQEVQFQIQEATYSLSDPYDRLHVAIVPNWRWDRSIGGLPPRFVKGAEIDFQRSGYVFEGGNTQRFIDLKGLEFTARGIQRLEERSGSWHAYLTPLERRTYDYFGGGQDIHGAMVTHNDRLEVFTGSDYIETHWRLHAPHPLVGQELFVVGAFTQHQCLPEFQLQYDAAQQAYTHKALLKQGYMDYMLVARDANAQPGDPGSLADLEGSHFQTNNLYTLVVYYDDWDGYDRVIGLAQWETNP